MKWIYISPHLDDAALSCGGLIWQQSQAGDDTAIWTICAGDPPSGPISPFAQSLHDRWETGPEAIAYRRAEDIASCQVLGAAHRHFSIPDCIYRRLPGGQADESQFLYPSEESLNGALHPVDQTLSTELGAQLAILLPESANIICPLTIGAHVDHLLVRSAMEKLGRPLWYYADYPYIAQGEHDLEGLLSADRKEFLFSIPEAAQHAWEASITMHTSQISTFWDGEAAMKAELRAYAAHFRGILLWKT